MWSALAAFRGTYEAIAAVLAVRFLLLLGIGGAFALGMRVQDWLGLAVLCAFCGFVVIPLVWLDHTTRRG